MSEPSVSNPIVRKGAIVYNDNGDRAKQGDGRRHYNDLPFLPIMPGPQGDRGRTGPRGSRASQASLDAKADKEVAGGYRFQDGVLQLWNPDTELFHPLTLSGVADEVTMTFGEGEA